MNQKNTTNIVWLCGDATGKQDTDFTIEFLSEWEALVAMLTNKQATPIDLLIIDATMFTGL